MKKTVLFIAALLVLYSCGKLEPEKRLSVKFYNMPLENIKKLLYGKWVYKYGKGGFCGTCIWQFNNCCFVEFTYDDKFIDSGPIRSDTAKIKWVKYKDPFAKSPNDTTYIINIHDQNMFILQEIYFDTLIFRGLPVDAITYRLIKSTN